VSNVTTKQPALTPDVIAQWAIMRDTDAGNARIHSHDARITSVLTSAQRTNNETGNSSELWNTYLPVPGGFLAQWANGGRNMWQAYMKRAVFPEIISPAINSMVGIVHKQEWRIELPESMEFIRENATDDGATIEAFSRRITRELLLMGRYIVSVDRPASGGEPYLTGHKAETLINWDTNFYVMNESGMYRNGYGWEEKVKYRVYAIDEDGKYYQELVDESGEPLEVRVYPETNAGSMNKVPVVVAGPRDITSQVENPPLMGAADSAIAIYRLDADYRHQLYMSGQETLVVNNADAPDSIGPAVVLQISGTTEQPADVFYVSPTCAGIAAHKIAIEDQWEGAAKAGAKLFDSGAEVESGQARRMRQNAESATLQTIANSSAEMLEMALRNVAEMVGANPDDVVVTPPRNLLDAPMSALDVVNMVKAWREGGFSYLTLYENLQRGQIASDERDSDEELSMMNTPDSDLDSEAI